MSASVLVLLSLAGVVVEPYRGQPKVRRSVKGRVKAACEPALVCRGQSKLNGTRLVTIKLE